MRVMPLELALSLSTDDSCTGNALNMQLVISGKPDEWNVRLSSTDRMKTPPFRSMSEL